MNISYQYANPHKGNQSFVIRLNKGQADHANCILVDAGDGVKADQLLGPEDELAAILLTHAHLDHYQSLDEAHVDDVPILTSPDTAALLEDVFAEGERHYGLGGTDRLRDNVQPISDWTDLLGDTISIRPVPAGHTPGACGFLVRVHDGADPFHALVTGDFTLRDAAGYPGFDPSAYLNIDALFLTAATVTEDKDQRTDIVATLADRANAGSTTLCTASGLTGVHLATLLTAVGDTLDYAVPVVLVGQVAKLYDALGYDHPTIKTIPEFSDPRACLDPGTVTIAGPEVPVEGSSRRLYEAARTDGNASLIQVQSGNTTAKDAGDFAGLVESFDFSNHPTEQALDDVVETISPSHVIIVHQSGSDATKYKDKWDAYSWANRDTDQQTIYREGDIVAPPWVGESVKQRVRERDGQTNAAEVGDAVLQAAMTPPEFGRREDLDLTKEGINVTELKSRLRIGPTASTPPSKPAGEPDMTSGQESSERYVADGGLYRTVGPDRQPISSVTVEFDDQTNPAVEGPFFDTIQLPVPGDTDRNATDTGNDDVETTADTAQNTTEADGVETASNDPSADHDSSHSDPDEQTDDPGAASAESNPEEKDGNEDPQMHATSEANTRPENADLEIDIDPVIRALAQKQVRNADSTMSAFVADAVESYLAATLRGDEPWTDTGAKTSSERALHIDADPALERLLARTADQHEETDVSGFVLDTLCDALGIDLSERTIAVRELDSTNTLVTAVTENDDCPHDTRADVLRDSLRRAVLNQPTDG